MIFIINTLVSCWSSSLRILLCNRRGSSWIPGTNICVMSIVLCISGFGLFNIFGYLNVYFCLLIPLTNTYSTSKKIAYFGVASICVICPVKLILLFIRKLSTNFPKPRNYSIRISVFQKTLPFMKWLAEFFFETDCAFFLASYKFNQDLNQRSRDKERQEISIFFSFTANNNIYTLILLYEA